MLKKSGNRQVYLQAHVQLWEEKHRLGLPQKSSRKPDSASPDDEKKDQEKETYPSDASSTVCQSHCWTSDDDASWSENPPDAAEDRTRQAQQREQQEDY